MQQILLNGRHAIDVLRTESYGDAVVHNNVERIGAFVRTLVVNHIGHRIMPEIDYREMLEAGGDACNFRLELQEILQVLRFAHVGIYCKFYWHQRLRNIKFSRAIENQNGFHFVFSVFGPCPIYTGCEAENE